MQATIERFRRSKFLATCTKSKGHKQMWATTATIINNLSSSNNKPQLLAMATWLDSQIKSPWQQAFLPAPMSRLAANKWTNNCFRSLSWPTSRPASSIPSSRTPQATLVGLITQRPRPFPTTAPPPTTLTSLKTTFRTRYSEVSNQARCRWIRGVSSDRELTVKVRRAPPVACRGSSGLRLPSSTRWGRGAREAKTITSSSHGQFPPWRQTPPPRQSANNRCVRSLMVRKIAARTMDRARSMLAQFRRNQCPPNLRSSSSAADKVARRITPLLPIRIEIKVQASPNSSSRVNHRWPNSNNSSSRFSSSHLFHKSVAMANTQRAMDQVKN